MSARWTDFETDEYVLIVASLRRDLGELITNLDVYYLSKTSRTGKAMCTEVERFCLAIRGEVWHSEATPGKKRYLSYLRRRNAARRAGIKVYGSDDRPIVKAPNEPRADTSHRRNVPDTTPSDYNVVQIGQDIAFLELPKHPLYEQMSPGMKIVYDDRMRDGRPCHVMTKADGKPWIQY